MELPDEGVIRAHECGLVSNCPFCVAAENRFPSIGTSIVFLRGHDAGCRGVVRENPNNGTVHYAFTVKMDYEIGENTLRMVRPGLDLFLDVRQYEVPDWIPSLSIDDNIWLHEEMFRHVSKRWDDNDHQAMRKILIGFIWACSARRLPVNGEDVFKLLEAHGFLSRIEKKFVEQFDFGIEVLTSIHGRAPIKRRRMLPMSKGRYLTVYQREFINRLRGSIGKNDV